MWDTKFPHMYETQKCQSSFAFDDGRLYFLGELGKPLVYCINTSDGSIRWRTKLTNVSKGPKHSHAGSPLLWDDVVIVNAGGGVAVTKDTGKVVWEHEGHSGLATPVLYTHERQPAVALFTGNALISRAENC